MSAIPAIPLSNVHTINQSPALVQNVYPMQQQTVLAPVQQPRYAVYDKPADRRLRPWILLGSVLLGVCVLINSLNPLYTFKLFSSNY
jgi:hypothetical protein